MARYKVNNGISFRRDGHWVHAEPGETVELPPKIAEAFVQGGDVEKISEPRQTATAPRSERGPQR